jgi:hypothetical protein
MSVILNVVFDKISENGFRVQIKIKCILVNFQKIKNTEKVNICGATIVFMKEILKMICVMVLDLFNILMEDIWKDSGVKEY